MSGRGIDWTVERLSRVCRHEEDCWLWTGYHSGNTPLMRYRNTCMHVRRAGLLMAGRTLKPGTYTVHRDGCVPGCVNPDHAMSVTGAKYHEILNKRGVMNNQLHIVKTAASNRRRSKLTAEQVDEIRRRVAAGERKTDIGKEVGLSADQISKICRGVLWKPARQVPGASVFSWAGSAA